MSTLRPRRIGRGAAERMLRGGPVDGGAGVDPLADLLTAAAAPARVGELDGEEAAVAAFREARLAHVTQPRREPMNKTLLARLLTMKIAAIAAGATVISGVAVAAGTGVLPGVGGGAGTEVSPTAGATASADVSASGVPSADASASASLLALCHSYQAAAETNPDTVLDSPTMQALVTAAGGRAEVDAYCATALRAQANATVAPGAAGVSVAPGGAGADVAVGGAGAEAGVGGGGTGAEVTAGPGTSAGVNVGATDAGVGAQVPGAATSASASTGPGGLGVGAGVGGAGADASVGR
ncbi:MULTISPECIES: hypothetical protein [Pseudofrankia]|uniref:hypothetical protein n=1 Tax=Pseudofrankia TaxID=2994363 RepID=UPI000234BE8B|nr:MULTISPECIES: hypothetical protein [Pseudofrankia]OHV39766.1 hypothetical protein BCD49_39930 [Pseudofrankia sp. EUN1h]